MNFFAHQEQARRQTRRMLVLFALAVVLIVLAIDAVVVVLGGLDVSSRGAERSTWLVLATIGALATIGTGSLYRIASLSGGGGVVARQMGGTPVDPATSNFAYRRLRNIVEEIAIASGVPVPQIFVLENEAGINAFASGFAPADAAVTVTRGALDKLTRDELQGVIGHEFSHLLNGDMRLNIRLMGVVFGIVVVATIGRKVLEGAGRTRSRDSGGVVAFGAAIFVIGYLGVVLARLIKASISRQREFLADASAVQFTRQASGIVGALKKLCALAEGSTLSNSNTEEVAHMLFGDGVGYSALFATHPPLGERIVRLDPSFNDAELAAIAAAWTQPVLVADDDAGADISISGFAPANASLRAARDHRLALPDAGARLAVTPAAVAAQVGNPDTDDRRSARTIHATIPDALREAAYRQEQAAPLILAMLLDAREDVRRKQKDALAARYDSGFIALVESLAQPVADLHPMLRLPLASLAFPALRRRPRPQLDVFVDALNALVAADGRVDLDEYCLAKLIRLQVIDSLAPAAASAMGRVRLPQATGDVAALFGIVARYGHDDDASASRAFQAAIADVMPGAALAYAPPEDFVQALDRALATLDRLSPAGKELVIAGLTRAISEDGTVRVAEAELLRVIAAALHCPLPPLIADASIVDVASA